MDRSVKRCFQASRCAVKTFRFQSEFPGPDHWRTRLHMARLWAEAVNRRGGDVTVVHLPEIGIRGNTHFPFSNLNNIEIADLLSVWLHEKGLD